MFNYIIVKKREYIFIILTATIFFLLSFTYSFSKENVFTVDDVKIEGKKDLNFSRDKYINQAFKNSFETMISKILLTKDLNKVKNIKLDTIKGLIDSFQILDESFKGQKYSATFKIFYNQKKIKKFLSKKNISFIQPKNISALFYPLLFVNDEVKNLSENYFYNEWGNNKIENELINFILPIDDLDDIKKIKENKNRIEDLKIEDFVNKYNLENFVFTFMDYKNNKLNVYIKANFNNSMKTKNLSYELSDINNKKELVFILKDLKKNINDVWKEENVLKVSVPLYIKIKYKHKKLSGLDHLKSTLFKISIIERFSLLEFDSTNSIFEIHYYGNPKILKLELSKFNYKLKNDLGYWVISKK